MNEMKRILFIVIILSYNLIATAGDDASGNIPCIVDLSQSFSTYTMTDKDEKWVSSLIKNLNYKGKFLRFVRTTIPLEMNGTIINGAVYQAIEKPECFYVVPGDVMLEIGLRWPYNPGVGGFSMHSKKSQNFIVALNYQTIGVPFLSGSKVIKGKVTWKSYEFNRLKH